MRSVYIFLLRLHPRGFRQRFAEEMLAIFDQVAENGNTTSLFVDAFFSLGRQWALRPESSASSSAMPSHVFDGVPAFYLSGDDVPRMSALVEGTILAIAAFASIALLIRLGGGHSGALVGSHHVSRSHLLGAPTKAIPTEDLPAEVKVKPEPEELPIPPYFKIVLVLGALDTDRDGVISAAEIADAPEAIRTLDRNHDGKLSAEECGAPFGKLDAQTRDRLNLTFMKFHPVLAALDANHDGVISPREIANASVALKALDKNGDGKLTSEEFFPPRAARPAGHR